MAEVVDTDQRGRGRDKDPYRSSRVVGPLILKVVLIGIVIGLAIALTPTLVGTHAWGILAAIWIIAALVVLIYSTERGLPAKYLFPGVVMLVLFVIYPIISTFQTSFTNLGDGTRSSKTDAIASIIGTSVVQTPNAPRYNLTVGTTGSPTTGPFTFFLVNQTTHQVSSGTTSGLKPLAAGSYSLTGDFVTAAPGYTMLKPIQVNAANKLISAITVPTATGAIRSLGINQAFEGKTLLTYDAKTDTITNSQTHDVYHVVRTGDRDHFVDSAGKRASDQSWKAGVGFANYKKALTDSTIRNNFFGIFIWTIVFAVMTVALTFLLGLIMAVVLNDPRVRGQRFYRILLVLPYAMPGFIALLVWAGFFNQEFGLVNSWTHLNIDWLGNATWAKVAILITNTWMGTPYMFLVCTGALQSIPGDLTEAAKVDGASGFAGFRRITFPLLLVSVAPLLVASFAFNFNNYNAIQLVTGGGPFPADNPTAGGTDILISYTMRLAFGGSGSLLGFASAISVLLFILTGLIAFVQFRATSGLEEVTG